MKKSLATLLALMMALTLALPVLAHGEILEEITILMPGEETDEYAAFINGPFAQKVEEDLKMKVNFRWLSWSDYWDQKQLWFAAKEKVDLYWDGLTNLPDIVNRKEAQPLDDLLKEYWPESMNAIIPESQLAGGKVNGIQYGIPSAYAPSSSMYQQVCVRQDLLEGVGMTTIETADDLRKYAELVKENYPEFKGPADPVFKALFRYFDDEQYFSLFNDYLISFAEGAKKAVLQSDTVAFEKTARFNHEMYLDGLYGDELAIKYNERDSRMQTGLYIWVEGSLGKDQEILGAVQTADPTARLATYTLAPEKPHYINATGGEVLCIPYSATNPAGAIKFLTWLWANQDNYLFCLYGVKGQDWDINENGRLVTMSETASADGYFYEWMFRNANYTVFKDGVTDEYIEKYQHWDDNAIPSGMLGFAFNNEGFEAIQTACTEAWKNMTPILYGYVDYDENYPQAAEAMKTAGIYELVDEYNRQLAEYMAQNEK